MSSSNWGSNLLFEENIGQSSSSARYLARGPGYAILLSPEQFLFLLPGDGNSAVDIFERHPIALRGPSSLGISLKGARLVEPVGRMQANKTTHYLRGRDRQQWRRNVRNFGQVLYHDVYPGIDLIFYGKEGSLEYDFVVHPGADYRQIAIRLQGANDAVIDENGDLRMVLDSGEMRFQKPQIYQWFNDRKEAVPGKFEVSRAGLVGFDIGEFDRTQRLIIDPVLIYSTFLGGSDQGSLQLNEFTTGTAVDSHGNLYVTGFTLSLDFPTLNAMQGSHAFDGGQRDAFVAKFDRNGNAQYVTYLGGDGQDQGFSIAVDESGVTYVAGLTRSTDFPTTPSAFLAAPPPASSVFECFVAKFSTDGQQLLFGSYLGGDGIDFCIGAAVDAASNVYVVG
ncbi:MAG: SBBP repeat-containing protein, partial [Acidiferrobacterales bacterium]|nr:SBBP repeat-containing protein [Acidiferrobacterales bacterium]